MLTGWLAIVAARKVRPASVLARTSPLSVLLVIVVHYVAQVAAITATMGYGDGNPVPLPLRAGTAVLHAPLVHFVSIWPWGDALTYVVPVLAANSFLWGIVLGSLITVFRRGRASSQA